MQPLDLSQPSDQWVPNRAGLVHSPLTSCGGKSDSHRVGRSRRSRKGGSVAHVRVIHGCYTIAAEQEALCAYASSARF